MGLSKHRSVLMQLDKEQLIELLYVQEQQIQTLKNQVRDLTYRVRELEGRLSKKSHNSHKPPASDGYSKPNPQSQRVKSDRQPGGQPGHVGATLKRAAAGEVDVIQVCPLSCCTQCGHTLAGGLLYTESRQEFEVPVLKRQVIEHRAEVKRCGRCGAINQGQFPAHITQSVQYGKRLKAIATYLNQYQLVPYARLQEIMQDVFGVSLSQGTLVALNAACYQQLEASSQAIREKITQSNYAHFDETGLRVSGRLNWLHVASTPLLTHYTIHPKRGHAAIEAAGVLPQFKGCATHDHFHPYFKYAVKHSLCNAHPLRELVYLKETYNLAWCKAMQQCLLAIKETVDAKKALGFKALDADTLQALEQAYDQILLAGFKEMLSIPNPASSTQAKTKQHPAKNLLDRLTFKKEETLRFMYDFHVSFDNNLAERDIRMTKVKQKVSGCFRSQQGGEVFCRIKGYISTVKKHALPVLDALINIFPDTASLAIAAPVAIGPP